MIIKNWQQGSLTGLSIVPETKIKKIVVLLHGYMGDCFSNAPFGQKLFDALPETMVVIPDGVESVADLNDDRKRQWWTLTEFDGVYCSFMPYYADVEKQRLFKEIAEQSNKTAETLNLFIQGLLNEHGLCLSDCFLVGISQGGITSFEMVLFRQELLKGMDNKPLGGLISIGSGIVGADRINRFSESFFENIPVLLMRGLNDEIFPRTVDYFSKSILASVGFSVKIKEVDSGHYGLEHHCVYDIADFISSKMQKN